MSANYISSTNNGIISSVRGMPMKDLTSDGGSTFSNQRKILTRAYIPITTTSVQQSVQKKWIGNQPNSVDVLTRRKSQTVIDSLNVSGNPISFTSNNDPNLLMHVRNRVRR